MTAVLVAVVFFKVVNNRLTKIISRTLLTLAVSVLYTFSVFATEMQVHFIDVGQADASLVVCDGHAMLIDGGDAKSSSLIYTYLKNRNISHLDYIIGSHPDSDHIGGLAGALNYANADTAFCSVTEHDTRAFNSFVKYLGNQGKSITVPAFGSQYTLGGAQFKIVGPINKADDTNNNSLVIKLTHGSNTFLFTGDADNLEESDIIASGENITSTVLKVPHHGSSNATSAAFVNAVAPKYAVISVGANNQYGHPSAEVLSRLESKGTEIYRTDLSGDIICTSDGQNLTFTTEKTATASGSSTNNNTAAASAGNASGESDSSQNVTSEYILNTNTKKFHYPSCSSVKKMKDKNKQSFNGSREEAIAQGYSPCGNCHP